MRLRSLGNKCWGEESLIRLELGKVAEEKQMEWEAAVLGKHFGGFVTLGLISGILANF